MKIFIPQDMAAVAVGANPLAPADQAPAAPPHHPHNPYTPPQHPPTHTRLRRVGTDILIRHSSIGRPNLSAVA
jgi:hypothetical protein